jgi:DNA-binding response OmpR family regulator
MMGSILIIEDETSLARNIKDYLEDDGLEARICDSGEAGLAAFAARKPDLVLLDLRLPGMDGLAVLRTLRTQDPEATVIMMTAHGGDKVAVEALLAGAHTYLAKPVVLSELRRIVEHALSARGRRN